MNRRNFILSAVILFITKKRHPHRFRVSITGTAEAGDTLTAVVS